MVQPLWKDKDRFGSMARAGLWLEAEVGEGNIFTKTDLREAFPEVAQIDRRMRQLRDYGWKIDTSREDDALRLQEQRYVKKGAEVWLPGQAKAKPKASLTAAQRTRVMLADNFLCRSCGIGAGESYEDGADTGQLDIARRKVRVPGGEVESQFVTECKRCRVGGREREDDLQALLAKVRGLTGLERGILAGWVAADRRAPGPLEEIWGQYRALPEESRAQVKTAIEGEEG